MQTTAFVNEGLKGKESVSLREGGRKRKSERVRERVWERRKGEV